MSSNQLVTWIEIDSIVEVSRRVLLHGIPSTGKTYRAEQMAKYAITLHEASSADELRGSYIPKGSEFVWNDGICIRAWREGEALVLNEINRASDEVKSFLYVICDNPESAKITLPTGETVKPAKGFRVIATMNGEPDELSDALRSRFAVTIEVNEPNPDAINSLPEDLRKPALESCTQENPARRLTLRAWIEFAMLRTELGDARLAAKAVFQTRYNEMLSAIALAPKDEF